MNSVKNIEAASVLLQEDCIPLSPDKIAQLQLYMDLIRQWNTYGGLVSNKDIDHLDLHILDSLSLCPYVRQAAPMGGSLLDIGSGGGFPAIPIKVMLPEMTVTLVERTERKVAFLIKAAAALGLQNVTVHHGQFPYRLPTEIAPHVITARAIEQAETVAPKLADCLPAGGVYLCQTRLVKPLDPLRFHVEHIVDAWSRQGLRRGALTLVKRIG